MDSNGDNRVRGSILSTTDSSGASGDGTDVQLTRVIDVADTARHCLKLSGNRTVDENTPKGTNVGDCRRLRDQYHGQDSQQAPTGLTPSPMMNSI